MSIELRCENCGKTVRAPREAAGKRGKCPGCGMSLYIPTPEEEIEELPLAPEDESEREREARLLAERRQLDYILSHEDRGRGTAEPPEVSRPRGAAEGSAGRTSASGLEAAVIEYLKAMRDSNFDRAEEALRTLKGHRAEVLDILDRLAADQLPPPEVANLPPPVYQGFLKSLRGQV